jgi:hypothetical protein
MTVSLGSDVVVLSGPCGVEEVETLVTCLQSRPGIPVDVGQATSVHTALWQALLVFRAPIVGSPAPETVAGQVFSRIQPYISTEHDEGARLAGAAGRT